MELDVHKINGSLSGEKVALNPAIFGIEPNDHAIYQDVRSIMANKHQGTHKVKARNEVRGGGKKPFRQKKTGRARAGTTRSGIWVGGGSIFGPMPHDYVVKLPRTVKKLARKSALSHKAKDLAIIVVEDFTLGSIKTKEMAKIIKALALDKKKILLLTAASDQNIVRSGRNIEKLFIQIADKASTYEILNNQVLLVQKSALSVLESSLKN